MKTREEYNEYMREYRNKNRETINLYTKMWMRLHRKSKLSAEFPKKNYITPSFYDGKARCTSCESLLKQDQEERCNYCLKL